MKGIILKKYRIFLNIFLFQFLFQATFSIAENNFLRALLLFSSSAFLTFVLGSTDLLGFMRSLICFSTDETWLFELFRWKPPDMQSSVSTAKCMQLSLKMWRCTDQLVCHEDLCTQFLGEPRRYFFIRSFFLSIKACSKHDTLKSRF